VNDFNSDVSAAMAHNLTDGTRLTLSELVDGVRRHYDDGCFACGRANPSGLHIDDFRAIPGGIAAGFVPGPFHRGTFGVLHGGLAATALDEIMAWAGIILAGVLCVTAKLELRFRHTVPVGQSLGLSARLGDRSGRRLRVTGELASADGPAVEATGLYVVAHQVSDLLRP
jgi:acyl-coenzyme A thioesterase PaaI-like protein